MNWANGKHAKRKIGTIIEAQRTSVTEIGRHKASLVGDLAKSSRKFNVTWAWKHDSRTQG